MTDAILSIILNLTMAVANNAEATLVFAGDAMMHQAQIEAARKTAPKNGATGQTTIYDYTDCFTKIKPLIEAADFAVVNLETPLGRTNFTGYPCFNAPVSYASALYDAGFDYFLTANNHTLDRHERGLNYTIQALDSLKIPHIGTYQSRSQRAERVPDIVNVNGFKIGILNYTYGTNGIEPRGDVVVDYIDRQQMANDIAATRMAGAELIAVCIHWGEEYVLLPVASQRNTAKFLRDQGVEMIIGGHPHVVQPMELTKDENGQNQLTVWSLGNFISNMKTRDTRGGALAKVKLKRDTTGRAYISEADMEYIFTVPPSSASKQFTVYPIDSVPSPWKSHAAAFRKALK